jgi:hypothetical protein
MPLHDLKEISNQIRAVETGLEYLDRLCPGGEIVPVIVITGPVGVGKSTVALEAAGLLRRAQIAYALVDLPQIGNSWPSPSDDPWNERLIQRNLRALWTNFREAGASRLLLCRVLEERSLLRYILEAVPGSNITVVRLRASLEELHARLRARENPRSLGWYLDVATYLEKRLEQTRVEDILIETEKRPPAEIASEILQRAGWLL